MNIPTAELEIYLDIEIDHMMELVTTTLNRYSWREIFVNDKLKQATAAYKKTDRIGQDIWKFEFSTYLKWRRENAGVNLLVKVSESQMQWTQEHCLKHCREIIEGIEADAAELKEADSSAEPSDTYGSARWANDEDLAKATYFDEGQQRFLLGSSGTNRKISISVPETMMHGIVCGPTGCGKSSRVYIPNLVERTGVSAIVTEATAGDEEPDLFRKTSGFRKMAGQNIYKFNPADMTSHRINPLEHIKTFDQAAQAAQLIVQNTSNKISLGDQIWENSERQLLTVLIMHAVSEKASLGSIRQWLCKGADGLAEILLNSQFEKVQTEYDGFYKSSSEGFRNGVISGLMQRLNLWVSPKIVALTEATDINFENLVNERFTFYLAVPAHETRMKPLAALIFNFLLNFALEKTFEHPIALFLDEFTNYGYIPGIAEKLTIIRHREIPAILGFQDYVQMEKIYGNQDAGLLFSQPGTRIFFRPRDINTAKKITDALGTKTIVDRKVTSSGHIQEREISRQLMNPGEVMALDINKAIAFTPASPPLLLNTFPWQQYANAADYESPTFRKIEVSEELVRRCETANTKPDWQHEWETKRSKNKDSKRNASEDERVIKNREGRNDEVPKY
jgi:type IV secretory pathway TraG/TraD family ATPase VirD4